MRLARIGTPGTQLEHELVASIHDSMSIGHDRGYKKLGWWLKDMCPPDLSFCLRIIDLEEIDASPSITAYQYCLTSSAISPLESINLMVTHGHICFLMPTTETYP